MQTLSGSDVPLEEVLLCTSSRSACCSRVKVTMYCGESTLAWTMVALSPMIVAGDERSCSLDTGGITKVAGRGRNGTFCTANQEFSTESSII